MNQFNVTIQDQRFISEGSGRTDITIGITARNIHDHRNSLFTVLQPPRGLATVDHISGDSCHLGHHA